MATWAHYKSFGEKEMQKRVGGQRTPALRFYLLLGTLPRKRPGTACLRDGGDHQPDDDTGQKGEDGRPVVLSQRGNPALSSIQKLVQPDDLAQKHELDFIQCFVPSAAVQMGDNEEAVEHDDSSC